MSDTPTWEDLRVLIESGDYRGLVEAGGRMDAAARKAITPQLKAYGRRPPGDWDWWINEAAVALAGAAVLPNPSTLAPWLLRHEPRGWARASSAQVNTVSRVVDVLTARGVDWLPDLVERIGAKLRYDQWGYSALFDLVERLRRRTGAAPPTGDGYLTHWIESCAALPFLRKYLQEDPRFRDRVTQCFEVDNVGRIFERSEELPRSLAVLASDGTLDRSALHDACLARLQRGGRPGVVRGFLRVLVALDPPVGEVAPRVRDYVALSTAGLSTVAGLAQTTLFALDDAGGLEIDDFLDATRVVLARDEKKLVRAQLARMAQVAARSLEVEGLLASAASTAFAHPAPDIAAAAITFVETHASALDGAARAALMDDGALLPADLRARLGTALGMAAGTNDPAASVGRPAVLPRRRIEAVSSPAELAEVVLTVLRSPWDRPPEMATVERALEGLVRYSSLEQPDTLRVALAPVLDSSEYDWARRSTGDRYDYSGNSLDSALVALVAAAVGDPPVPDLDMFHEHGHRGLAVALLARAFAYVRAVRDRRNPAAVSLPTWSTGHIDAAELAARLHAAREGGRSLLPDDLAAAMLRVDVPPHQAPELTAELAWLEPELRRRTTDSLPTRFEQVVVTVVRWGWDDMTSHHGPYDVQVLDVRPASDNPDPVPGDAGAWMDERTLDASTRDCPLRHGAPASCFPALAPRHRELVAASLVRWPAAAGEGSVAQLSLLAESGGPAGVAMTFALAQGLGDARAEGRMAAVDAILILAARQELDGALLGRTLATLTARGEIVLSRARQPLRDAAAGGATREVWDTLAAVLDGVLGSGAAVSGLADLLALAAELAQELRPEREIDGLAGLAGRTGRSRQVVEARRLLEALSRS